MESLADVPLANGALILIDSAPIIYVLEGHSTHAGRFLRLFERHAAGEIQFAVSTVTILEVMTGPLGHGNGALAERYKSVLSTWRVVELTLDIAAMAARLRASLKLKLPDAVQAASALAINADALVTHDRDFSRLTALPVLV